MLSFKQQLLSVLGEIKGGGSFVSSGIRPFQFPGIEIRGVDEIGFPINNVQIKELIKVAHIAPFGKGSETIVNTAVRNAWEINASEIAFRNKDWEKFIESIIKHIKPDLGIEDYSVSAHLYKLLIYEEGGFFVSHKDSEKEKGMFGTLIIGLPSRHEGGELLVRFDNQEEKIEFAEAASQYKMAFAAFYADCDHEIKPVISGHRVCLVYNLIQNKGKEKIEHQPLASYVDRLVPILKAFEGDGDIRKIVLLGHQYTPENFSMETLKLNDRQKAAALLRAAGQAGYFAKLCLVTSYQVGDLLPGGGGSSRSRRGYYYNDFDDDELENGTMGEVYDEQINIENWIDDGLPTLGNIEIGEEDLITSLSINEGEPAEKEAEGYTGNAGMEMTYWYHYGAIFLWPKKYHYDVLNTLEPDNKLEWVDYYNRIWNSLEPDEVTITTQLAKSCSNVNIWRSKSDLLPLVNLMININSADYFILNAPEILTPHFLKISVENWVKLFESYPCYCFETVFSSVAGFDKTAIVLHLLEILNRLRTKNPQKFEPFILQKLEQLPVWLNSLRLSDSDDKMTSKEILRNVLALEEFKTGDHAWLNTISSAFTRVLSRSYINDVLMEVFMESGNKSLLSNQIMAVCKEDLRCRVKDIPQPPSDWSRVVPTSEGDQSVWRLLKDFLQSPTLQVFDYKALQGLRSNMENAIRHVTIDLTMETIRKGSPRTLRLTKTQAAYERDLAKWKIDMSLLDKAEKW